MTYKPFNATVLGSTDFVDTHVVHAKNDLLDHIPAMAILTPIMEIHITKEQAMAFFGLVDATR